MGKPHIVILGAGPAGLGAAYKLAVSKTVHITVLEQNSQVGGNASSFLLAGLPVDYGSHRLHPSCDPKILADIRSLLGPDLLDRPRHGRIHLRGRWIHFPLKPLDLALRLPPAFVSGVAGDMLAKVIPGNGAQNQVETFASIMEKGLGKTICRDFYFPYARKIWGLEPEDLAAAQARRRVSNNSLGKMVHKVLSAIPGLKPKGSGRFFYPRQGYGQISNAYYRAAVEAGSRVLLNTRVESLDIDQKSRLIVHFTHEGQPQSLAAEYVWSTIPITILAQIIKPAPPEALLQASQRIAYRAMLLIYLVLEQDRFSEYDAHYFPEEKVKISRLSEPKNYNLHQEPQNRTVLCAELPCIPDGTEWKMADADLGKLVCDSLAAAGIPINTSVLEVVVRRLRHAYPIYHQGYETLFNQLDEWIGKIDGLLTFGRQGLFAHDNTHHALYMAYSAVDCLNEDGTFSQDRWRAYRQVFETHVVED